MQSWNLLFTSRREARQPALPIRPTLPTMSASDSIQGTIPSMVTAADRTAALDQAFDYRGDVTIETHDGQTFAGYVFDRHGEGDQACVRLLPSNGAERVRINYDQIKRLEFSGRDTAAGKSWETWLKHYAEKKEAGESADLHPDTNDD